MAYHGYFGFINNYLTGIQSPCVLEVGVDKGQTFLPLVFSLAKNKSKFNLLGVDILFRDHVKISLGLMSTELTEEQHVSICEEDSLTALSKISKQEDDGTLSSTDVFDMILLDGDHNYKTVSSELVIIDSLLKGHGIIVIDDFDMVKDEFFGEKEEYIKKNIGNKREGLTVKGKQGVQQAVCDFVKKNNEYKLFKLAVYENESPVLLSKVDLSMINKKIPGLIVVINIDDE